MLYASDFREKAREALNGKWGLAVGTGFVATLMGAYTALDNSTGGGSSGRSDESNEALAQTIARNFSMETIMLISAILLAVGVAMIVVGTVWLIISGPTSVGYAKFNLNLVDNNLPQFRDLFWGFNYFGKTVAMQLLRILYIFLWTLCFIIPGLIAQFKYALAPYLMAENPEMSPNEAISESKRLMDGEKWRLFCLEFSFIGWYFLCLLTLGIGFLWLRPYKEAAYAAFYREIKDRRYSNPYIEEETTSSWTTYTI